MSALVSVVLPNYNHARFLPQRIASIAEQTYPIFEFIALDDCSTDQSREVLKAYSGKLPMKLVFNEVNSGSTFRQWRKGAELATGEYLWIAESDDFADKDLLAALVAAMERNPRVGLAYCQSYQVNEAGEVIRSCAEWTRNLDQNRWDNDFVNAGRDEVARFLVIQNTIPNASAVLVKREAFLRALDGAESYRLSGDWLTWIRLLLDTDVAFVGRPLNYFRVHRHTVRLTTKVALACEEQYALKSFACARVPVARSVRSKAFATPFHLWREVVYQPDFRWDGRWFRSVLGKAASAHLVAAAHLLARVPLIYFKRAFRRSAAAN